MTNETSETVAVRAADPLQALDELPDLVRRLNAAVEPVVVGQRLSVDAILYALFSRGHCLLVGVPGLGKTLLVNTVACLVDLPFSRIQFTPDLMPSDITGTEILEEDAATGHRKFVFARGPIFTNVLLADEINRTPPKTQAALLEAMQEKTVTSGTTTYKLDDPFLVMATQNPLEMEGTYPLPEAQLDRFLLKILVGYPSEREMATIVDRTVAAEHPTLDQVVDREQILDMRRAASQVLVAPHVRDFAIRVVLATQPEHEHAHDLAKRFIRYGSSPRGAQSLILCGRVQALMRGRLNVSTGDVKSLALSALRHRIILNFDAHAEGHTPDSVLKGIMAGIPEPAV